MADALSLQNLYLKYKRWVIENPSLITDAETVLTWSSYFVAGKINKSPVVSELIYSLSKLVSLFNDRLLEEAYGRNAGTEGRVYGLREQISLCLTVIHYSEVFVELVVKRRCGVRGKWVAAALLQALKCSGALVLLHRYGVLPTPHPPLAPLQRNKLTLGRHADDTSNCFFTLRRSGRVVRRVEGAPPAALRDWEPPHLPYDTNTQKIQFTELTYAESLHILKPLIHLTAMRVFGTQSWRQWLVALGIDVATLRLYNRHISKLGYDQRLELSRRKLTLLLYLFRSPMYNGYSKNVIENMLTSLSKKMPITSFISGPIIQYLSHWQDIYFYMWAS